MTKIKEEGQSNFVYCSPLSDTRWVSRLLQPSYPFQPWPYTINPGEQLISEIDTASEKFQLFVGGLSAQDWNADNSASANRSSHKEAVSVGGCNSRLPLARWLVLRTVATQESRDRQGFILARRGTTGWLRCEIKVITPNQRRYIARDASSRRSKGVKTVFLSDWPRAKSWR